MAADSVKDIAWRQFADCLAQPVLCVGADGHLFYVNEAIESVMGYGPQVVSRLYNQAGSDTRLLALQAGIQQQLDRQLPVASSEQLELTHRDGFRVMVHLHCVHQEDGVVCTLGKVSAVSESFDSLTLAAKVFDSSLAGIYITDAKGRIIQINKAFTRLTGFSFEEMVGNTPQCIDVERYSAAYFKSITDSLVHKGCWEGEIQHRRKDGQVFPAWVSLTVLRDESGNIINTISHFTDITEKKNTENKIHRLAYIDPLTGLPNRSLFSDRFSQAINRAKRQGSMIGLLFLDLDRFKIINDSLGHAIGDAVLHRAGQRLRDCVRTDDTVARMGGDEFTVLLSDLKDRTQAMTAAAHIAEKIRHVLAEPYVLRDRKLYSSASIGIAFYPSDGAEPKTLLQHADTAMYYAKAQGKNNYQFYTSNMNAKARERLELEHELRKGIEGGNFELYYQPILSADEGSVVAVEALVRWQHPEKGMIMPNDFIEVAEASGLIRPLGAWVLREACRQWLQWREEGMDVQCIAINVSAKQFNEDHILRALRDIVADDGIDPSCIQIELTESALMEDHQFAQETLEEIRRLGAGVSIDDFGTGYSSLNYLKNFPIDTLKVDRSFIEGLPAREDQQIVRAIVALAKSLGLKVVAEGIENPMQLEFVQQLGCDEVQGYMLSEPMPPQEIQL